MTLALPSLEKSDVLDYEGVLLRFDRQWDDGTLSLTRVRTDRPFILENGELPTDDWLLSALSTGRLNIVGNKVTSIHSRMSDQRPNGLEDWRLNEARRVQFVLTELDRCACPASNNAIKRHLAEVFTPDVVARLGGAAP